MSSRKHRKLEGGVVAAPQGMSCAEFIRQSEILRQKAFVRLHTFLRQCFANTQPLPPVIPPPPSNNNGQRPGPTCALLPLIHDYRHQCRLILSLHGAGDDIPGCDLVGMGSNESEQLTSKAKGTGVYYDDETGETVPDNMSCAPQRLAAPVFFQNVKTVAAGCSGTSFAVTMTGQVYSWGCADEGGLGRIEENEDAGIPTEVTGFFTTEDDDDGTPICEDGSIVDVVAGAGHALFLTLRGNLYMCGMYKDQDSLKAGHDCTPETVREFSAKPVPVQLPGKVLMACTKGSANAVVLEDKSTVYTWGFGNYGELARSETMNADNKLSPTDMYKNEHGIVDWRSVREHFLTPKPALFEGPKIKRIVVAISMGSNFLLVSARDPGQFEAKLYSSGSNKYGQLGHGNDCVEEQKQFHKLKLIESLAHEHIAQIAGGQYFALALSHDGKRLYSWGRADSGQLGRGYFETGKFDGLPKRVRFPIRYVDPNTNCMFLTQISAGETYALAVGEKHQLYSWGFNENGQTGHDASQAENDAFFPRMLDLLSHMKKQDGVTAMVDVHAISAGSSHSLVACRRYQK